MTRLKLTSVATCALSFLLGCSSSSTTTTVAGVAGGGGASSGGHPATGGQSSGGSAGESSGGKATGGAAGAATGGAGGAATGGAGGTATGGTATGGTATGGTATGGAATGGTATGGTATGGAATGGTATGGAATGGAATGGSSGVAHQSCSGLGVTCAKESCCTDALVPKGSFMMGRSEVKVTLTDYYSTGETNELPSHKVTVGDFLLDKYEVTVGRFRGFVTAYDAWRAEGKPFAGAGAHAAIAKSGWDPAWNASLPATSAVLASTLSCETAAQTWTASPNPVSEPYAINCVSWYEAMAFCIWDGGYLPTEAEWEYAAAGGSAERLYPWGIDVPDSTRANYYSSDRTSRLAVGSKPAGQGLWLHQDLGGGMFEWTLDPYDASWYSIAAATGTNVFNPGPAPQRVYRGGNYGNSYPMLRAAARVAGYPAAHAIGVGFRCARSL